MQTERKQKDIQKDSTESHKDKTNNTDDFNVFNANANANANDEDGDPYITRIKNTGCFNQHELLQDCFWVKKDWRKCKNEMEQFKKCMNPSI